MGVCDPYRGPCDDAYLLLSMKYPPNVLLVDMAHMVPAHCNIHNLGIIQHQVFNLHLLIRLLV